MIYLDYNATTPLCDAAREAMLPYLGRYFGNPSSVHAAGREARAAIDNARDKLGALLRAKPGEIIFTGGATESCNLAVLGLARSSSSRGGHIISNKAEHHAVLHPLEHLEQHEGFEVTWLNVSESGMENGCRCLACRCRELCCAQVLWTKGYRLSLSSRRPIDPANHVRGRTRKSAAPWDRKRGWHRGNGCCRGMDIARSRDGAGTQSPAARSIVEKHCRRFS